MFRLTIMSIALSINSWVISDEVLVRTPSGENVLIEVNPYETFAEVMGRINASVESDYENSYVIDFMYPELRAGVDPFSDDARVYNGPITQDQIDDLRYILKSMATKSWSELLKSKNSMNRAGDNIDNIHPLNFLACIFKNVELKGYIHCIKDSKDRKRIWESFFEGLEKSLREESQRNNIKPEHVQDFANNLGIKVSDISHHINNRDWDDLVKKLLSLLPRQGNPGRYDM